jgi:hypothetical protein
MLHASSPSGIQSTGTMAARMLKRVLAWLPDEGLEPIEEIR